MVFPKKDLLYQNKISLIGFEDLMRAYNKALPVIAKEESGVTPRFYVRCLVELEDFISEMWEDREGRKNMSKNNSKSLTSMRQKLRKYNKDFEEDIAKFRENPDQPDDEEEEEKRKLFKIISVYAYYIDYLLFLPAEPEVDSDEEPAPKVPTSRAGSERPSKPVPVAKPGVDDDQESDDSMDWGSDSESSSESSDDEAQYTSIRERFLKK